MAPPTTEPRQSGRPKPEAVDTETAMGAMRVMVPTDVPIERETKQLTTNKTATAKRAGMMESRK